MRRHARLVARRELRALLRDRGRLAALALVTGLAVVAAVGLGQSTHPTSHYRVGFLPAGSILAEGIQAEAPAFDTSVTLVPLHEAAVAEARLRTGQVELVTVSARQLLSAHPPPRDLAQLALATQLRLQSLVALQVAARAHVPVRGASGLLSVVALPSDAPSSRGRSAAAAAAGLTGLLLYLLMFFLSSSLVEEKASRVIELVLAATSPRAVLTGKFLGVGLVAVAAASVLVAVAEVAAVVSGVFSARVLAGGLAAVLGTVLAFVLFGSVYAVAGARVSRIDDLQYAQLPGAALLGVVVVLAAGVLRAHPPSGAAAFALVPLLGALLEPARIALGQADLVQAVACLLINLVSAPILFGWAVRAYGRMALRFEGAAT